MITVGIYILNKSHKEKINMDYHIHTFRQKDFLNMKDINLNNKSGAL